MPQHVLLVGHYEVIHKILESYRIPYDIISTTNKNIDDIFAEMKTNIVDGRYDTVFFNNNKVINLSIKYYTELTALSLKYKIKIIVNTPDLYSALHDKLKLYAFCQQHTIQSIPTLLVTEENMLEIQNIFNNHKICMVKPIDEAGGFNNYPCKSIDEIKRWKQNLQKDCIVQPFIDATILGINFIADEGQMLDYSIYESLNLFYNKKSVRWLWPAKRLVNSSIEAQLCTLCTDILKLTDYKGIGEFEVLWDKNTGRLALMDFNPRISGDVFYNYYNGGSFAINYVNWMLDRPLVPHCHFTNNFPIIYKRDITLHLQRAYEQDFMCLFKIHDWLYLIYIILGNLYIRWVFYGI